MIQYITLAIGAFVLSAACGFFFIPIILNYCKKKKLYDIPNARKMHKTLVPRLGGISFLPSMLTACMLALVLLGTQKETQKIEISLWSLYFFISLLLIYFVGIIDDLIGLDANIKFVVQIIAASILPLAGLYINNLYGLFGIHEIPFWIGGPLTVFVIIFIDNAMNLIDGIDGLCADLSLMALGGFLLFFWREGLYLYCMLIAALMGVLISYIYFNFFGKIENNRKIFMGDSGSLTLGFIIGFLFVKFTMDNPNVIPYNEDRLAMAYTLLIIPTFDVVRVVFYRLRHHKPIFDADKNHIHHKLIAIGLNQHQALSIIIALAFFFIALNIILFPFIGITLLLITDIIIYTLFNVVLNIKLAKKEKGTMNA